MPRPQPSGIKKENTDQPGGKGGQGDHDEYGHAPVFLLKDRAEEQEEQEVAEQMIPVGMAQRVGKETEKVHGIAEGHAGVHGKPLIGEMGNDQIHEMDDHGHQGKGQYHGRVVLNPGPTLNNPGYHLPPPAL